ncbi:SRPBCC family protein [Massilia sp. CF038]|uniref:SRPBCC family protein n=1 Tax=Massilia sp. CF038 TaxID=1881045 RepID=UPI0009128CDF|nr:SRPBCC family protein [Massilia sp. CF038]SHH42245.1 Ribosome association toxin PasT (RatA) of the RatAB toxin-antitoxin module [Massilia sp. CF038]
MIARILLCSALVFTLPALADEPRADVAVKRVDLEGEQVFDVTAHGTVKASPAAVWKILTDYERMPEFVPDLERTKVLSRAGNRATVEQFGRARFLFFSREIHLVVQVLEEPSNAIDIHLVTGDMKVYRCRWEITPVPETGGTRISYAGKMVPKFYVPGMLGSNIVRRDIERMMDAVLERLDRPDE